MFLLKAMLQYIGFNDATRIISDQELKFSPLNFAYTQAWMTINDVDAPYPAPTPKGGRVQPAVWVCVGLGVESRGWLNIVSSEYICWP